jgi:hypothetical protein
MNHNAIASAVPEEQRPVAASMNELASSIGNLETALRSLAGRVSPLLPAGSPFERGDKMAPPTGTSTPRPVRSNFTDELQSRIYALNSLTGSVNEMVKSIEL